jgi:Spy/CpxP family protein refolding chaperone
MTIAKLLGVSTLAAAALALTLPGAASARPNHHGQHRVCKWERHHGKRVQVCRWVHR